MTSGSHKRPAIAFVYGAREAILPATVRTLLNSGGVIGDVLQRCDAYIEKRLGSALRATLAQGDVLPEFLLEPALTATQIALTDAWRACAVTPQVIVARCGGEFAAAYARGVLTLENAMEVACRVGRVIERGLGAGRMLIVRADLAETERLQQASPLSFHVVSDDADNTTIVSLATPDLEAIEHFFASEGIASERVPAAIGPHCALVDDWSDELRRPLDTEATTQGRPAFFSAAAAGPLNDGLPDVDHIWRVVRYPARFGRALDAAMAAGHRVFVEIGTHPGLRKMIDERAALASAKVITLASISAGQSVESSIEAGANELERLGAGAEPSLATRLSASP